MGGQSAFESDMGCRAAHQFDEVVVFFRREGVAGNIADDFGIGFARSIESKGNLDVGALQISVDGLRHADEARWTTMR